MRQKTTWMRYLIIGISLFLVLLASRCKERVEPLKSATYIYKNESGLDLVLFFRSYGYDPGKDTYQVKDKDSLVFTFNTKSGWPFAGESFSSELTDSVNINFNNNRCLSFTRAGGNGVFRLPEYENYFNGQEDQAEFSLTFIFDKEWLAKTKDCN